MTERVEERVQEHESFGIVRVSQSQGGSPEFFGSPANTLNSHITLEIAPGEVCWKGAYPSYSASLKSHIRVRMTHAQFVGMMSSIGSGTGTPCTIEHRRDVDGTLHRMEDPPAEQTDTDRVKSQFKDKCRKLDMRLNFYYSQIDEMLNKKSLTKSDKETIRKAMAHISSEVRDNMPYLTSMFNEAAERIVSHAKNEVDAVINTHLKRLGIKAIKAAGISTLLGSGEDKSDDVKTEGQDITSPSNVINYQGISIDKITSRKNQETGLQNCSTSPKGTG